MFNYWFCLGSKHIASGWREGWSSQMASNKNQKALNVMESMTKTFVVLQRWFNKQARLCLCELHFDQMVMNCSTLSLQVAPGASFQLTLFFFHQSNVSSQKKNTECSSFCDTECSAQSKKPSNYFNLKQLLEAWKAPRRSHFNTVSYLPFSCFVSVLAAV